VIEMNGIAGLKTFQWLQNFFTVPEMNGIAGLQKITVSPKIFLQCLKLMELQD
jgi:hypothetical protein